MICDLKRGSRGSFEIWIENIQNESGMTRFSAYSDVRRRTISLTASLSAFERTDANYNFDNIVLTLV